MCSLCKWSLLCFGVWFLFCFLHHRLSSGALMMEENRQKWTRQTRLGWFLSLSILCLCVCCLLMMPAGPSWGKRATPITHDHHNSKENGVDERSVACSTQTSWNFVREKKRKESHLEFFVCPSQLLMFHVLVSFFLGGGGWFLCGDCLWTETPQERKKNELRKGKESYVTSSQSLKERKKKTTSKFVSFPKMIFFLLCWFIFLFS